MGKTTLVKRFKAEAQAAGYFTSDDFVPVVSGDTAESLFGRFLGAVYETLLSNRPHLLDHPAMRSAQVLVRAAREHVPAGGVSIVGVGVNAGRSVTTTAPRDLLLDGPRALRDLMGIVRESGAPGALIHMNNLEKLSEADVARAAVVLRDLRDPLMMHPGLHLVLVGTHDAVLGTVLRHAQLRTAFSVHVLQPFDAAGVRTLLAERYAHLRVDSRSATTHPVEDAAIEELHAWYRGDLRGLLKALEDGVTPNIGLLDRIRPLRLDELLTTLRPRYTAELAQVADEARLRQLAAWGIRDPLEAHTQKSLQRLWTLKQSAVSAAVSWFARAGLVVALPREGESQTRYVLTGAGRVMVS